jgi:anti-sigma regulatory factor (Ser/Thr protein kinase)
LHLSLPAVAESVPTARRAVEEFAVGHVADLAPLRLAVSEAVSSAVQHASLVGARGEITVNAEQNGEGVVVEVSDPAEGPCLIPDPSGMPTGLSLIGTIADRVALKSKAAGTTVTMTFGPRQ